eukprot:1161484-Pelagomonas_calceolata.AAC.2
MWQVHRLIRRGSILCNFAGRHHVVHYQAERIALTEPDTLRDIRPLQLLLRATVFLIEKDFAVAAAGCNVPYRGGGCMGRWYAASEGSLVTWARICHTTPDQTCCAPRFAVHQGQKRFAVDQDLYLCTKYKGGLLLMLMVLIHHTFLSFLYLSVHSLACTAAASLSGLLACITYFAQTNTTSNEKEAVNLKGSCNGILQRSAPDSSVQGSDFATSLLWILEADSQRIAQGKGDKLLGDDSVRSKDARGECGDF